jgi:hypothetical protein
MKPWWFFDEKWAGDLFYMVSAVILVFAISIILIN